VLTAYLCLFKSFACFFGWDFCVLVAVYRSFSYTVDTRALSDRCTVNTFPEFVSYLYLFLNMYMAVLEFARQVLDPQLFFALVVFQLRSSIFA
jgi:hypothetical protein